MRIERTRAQYNRETNQTPLIIGGAFVLVVGIVLFLMLSSTPPTPAKRPNRPQRALLEAPASPNYGAASGRQGIPVTDETQAYRFVDQAKKLADTDPLAAVEKLRNALGRWPKYDAEIYFSMGVCVGKREGSVQGEALRQVYAEKAEHYQKALDLVENQGGKFAYGDKESRLSRLRTVLGVAREKAGQ
jgi:hypothetical protein